VATSVVLLQSGTASGAGYGDRAVQYWLGHQLPSGAFPAIPDETPAPHYGNTFMALAMVLRHHDAAAAAAVGYWIAHPPATGPHPPFNAFAALRTRRALGAAAPRSWTPVLRARMDHVASVWLTGPYVNNWSLIAAAAAIEADRAKIGHYRARVLHYLKRRYLPQIRSGYGGDPGAWPLAYHAFGLAWVAHVAALTGDAQLKSVSIAGCRVLVRLVSPMGRVAWYGRSYEESFAQAAAVYALRRCERWNRSNAGRYERTAVAALAMLRREHPTILGPLAIVPRMRFAQTIARDGTDNYAQLEVYNALTLALLAMAPAPLVAPAPQPAGVVLAQTALAAAGGPALATLRDGRAFLAVALRPAPKPLDGRSSFGVHRAEVGRTSLVPAMTASTAGDFDVPAATSVRAEGRVMVARGPGYTLRIRVDGCTVIEELRLSRARRVTVGGRLPLQKGEAVVATARGWRAQQGFVRIGRSFTRLGGRVEVGSDRYRTAVFGARVALPARATLQVERGVPC
jgi:hypothetical protein